MKVLHEGYEHISDVLKRFGPFLESIEKLAAGINSSRWKHGAYYAPAYRGQMRFIAAIMRSTEEQYRECRCVDRV